MQLELTEKTKLETPPDQIHSWLSDLENWPKIIDKIRSITVEGDKCIGELVFKGKTIDFAGMVPEDDDPFKVTCNIVVQTNPEQNRTEHMTVVYEIEPLGRYTRVIERIKFERQIPFWGWLLVKFIMKVGKPTGLTNLQRIKEHIAAESE
jgi:carbon monoxide dehydrogenase subunit G